MKKSVAKLKKTIIVIVGLCLIISLSKNIIKLLQAGQPLRDLKQEIASLKKEQEELIQKKKYYSSDEFIEKQARDVLNMAKPGETIVILPDSLDYKGEEARKENKPNWEKWLEVFF